MTAAGNQTRLRVALIGLGKMGISHCSIVNAHPAVDLVGICDTSTFALDILGKYTGLATFTNVAEMLRAATPDAVIVATPSASHASLVRQALEAGAAVFCEKPFTLDTADAIALTSLAVERQLVTQVGYHNRFGGAFAEVKRLLELQAIGDVTHVLGEAYGPVVLQAKGGTWRSKRTEGGGCLYDYAAHVIDLITWYIGEPTGVGGTSLNSVFSLDIDDVVASTMYYANGGSAQISANWSDESQRKMTTQVTLWGTGGRIYVDRQECQVFLREGYPPVASYEAGWNVRYTTELTAPVSFYLRGEEYSAQIDYFVQSVLSKRLHSQNNFASAAVTDRVIALMAEDAAAARTSAPQSNGAPAPTRRIRRWWSVPLTRHR